MLGATVKWSIDTRKFAEKVRDGDRKALSKAGAFIRRSMMMSMRKGAKRPSPPGKPPRVLTGTLRNMIRFDYDGTKNTVVVGPMKTNQVFFERGLSVRGTVPNVLEFGGTVGIREARDLQPLDKPPFAKDAGAIQAMRDAGIFVDSDNYAWRRVDLRRRSKHYEGRIQRIRYAQYAPRPYAGPALQKNAAKIPSFYEGAISE